MADANHPSAGSPTSPSSSLNPSSKRKRGSGAASTSSRGVANLTPEQLARKRANDREAQRAIRERTKQQIDTLNLRIKELESQQPYNDLQVVIRQKDAIQAENDEIKRRLASVMATIQPLLGHQGLHELAAAAERNPHPAPPAPPATDLLRSRFDSSGQNSHQTYSNPAEFTLNNTPSHEPTGSGHNSRQWLHEGDTSAVDAQTWHTRSVQQIRPSTPHADLPYGQDERLGVDFLLDSNQRAKMSQGPPLGATTTAPTHVIVSAKLNGITPPPYAMLPNILPATCPLDNLMMDFLAKRRASAARGVPLASLTGPAYPNFTPLVYPERNFESHSTSKVFTDIIRTFPDIANLPEQVAVVYIMFLVMRWQIDPSLENYDRLPAWQTPRASQLFTPHPSWTDYLPFPKLRDKLVSLSPHQPFDTFFVPYTTTLSLNWPYDPRDCLLPASPRDSRLSFSSSSISSPYPSTAQVNSPQTPATVHTPGSTSAPHNEHWTINPAFERHLRDLSNWTLGPAFATALPHLGGCVHIKSDS